MKLERITLCAIAIALSACTQNKQAQNTNFSKQPTESVANWEGCMVSAYLFQEDGRALPENSLELIEEFETLIEHDLGSVMWYPTFADNFPTKECKALKEKNIIPLILFAL